LTSTTENLIAQGAVCSSLVLPVLLSLGALDLRRPGVHGARLSPLVHRVTPCGAAAVAVAFPGLAVPLVIGVSALQVPRSR
jgi:hypothetical protein